MSYQCFANSGEEKFLWFTNIYYALQTLASHEEEQNKRKQSSGLCPTLDRRSDIRYLLLFGANLPAVLWPVFVSNGMDTRACT